MGDIISSFLCIAIDDIKIIAYFLKREILVILVQINSDNNKHIVCNYYMPLPGTIRDTRIYNIHLEEDNTMYYLKDRKKEDERTYIQWNILIQYKKGLIIYYESIHYDTIINSNISKLLLV